MNKDFFKALLKDEKRAYKVGEVSHIIVPKLDELGIKHMLIMIKDDVELKRYFPDEYFKKLVPDRAFFFNTINTMYPEFLSTLISNAHQQRMHVDESYQAEQTIEASDEWLANLQAIPFVSKVSITFQQLINLV